VLPLTQSTSATRWRCTPKETQECSPVGCERQKHTVWFLVDKDRRTYSRCNAAGCDTYGAEVSTAGIFTTYEVRGRATFLRMAEASRHFIGAWTEGVNSIVNGGTCEPER
jgi:hypothetical protein